MIGMYDNQPSRPPSYTLRTIFLCVVCAVLLVVFGAWLNSQDDLPGSNLDKVSDIVRENRNRTEVTSLRGKVTTVRETSGGPLGLFEGKLIIRQPFTVSYFVNMQNMSLSDYIWDEKTKTLFVRLPEITADPPNVDESRQEVVAKGWVITREMQQRLRRSIARGAVQQARSEAAKPENMDAARSAARLAITRNLSLPLRAAGVRDVRIEVIDPRRSPSERWDVSRSIAEVLAERSQ
jgi:hypothetical protein